VAKKKSSKKSKVQAVEDDGNCVVCGEIRPLCESKSPTGEPCEYHRLIGLTCGEECARVQIAATTSGEGTADSVEAWLTAGCKLIEDEDLVEG